MNFNGTKKFIELFVIILLCPAVANQTTIQAYIISIIASANRNRIEKYFFIPKHYGDHDIKYASTTEYKFQDK